MNNPADSTDSTAAVTLKTKSIKVTKVTKVKQLPLLHLGLLDEGDKVIVKIRNSSEKLGNVWKNYGITEVNLPDIKSSKTRMIKDINNLYKTKFKKLEVDYSKF